MPSKADRRPARDDFAPRWKRATVPAHSYPECNATGFLEFDTLIERQSPNIVWPPSTFGTVIIRQLARTQALQPRSES